MTQWRCYNVAGCSHCYFLQWKWMVTQGLPNTKCHDNSSAIFQVFCHINKIYDTLIDNLMLSWWFLSFIDLDVPWSPFISIIFKNSHNSCILPFILIKVNSYWFGVILSWLDDIHFIFGKTIYLSCGEQTSGPCSCQSSYSGLMQRSAVRKQCWQCEVLFKTAGVQGQTAGPPLGRRERGCKEEAQVL